MKVGAGVNFSILLSQNGQRAFITIFQHIVINQMKVLVFAVGSGEHGQLGNGRTGEHIAKGNRTMFDMYSEPGESYL